MDTQLTLFINKEYTKKETTSKKVGSADDLNQNPQNVVKPIGRRSFGRKTKSIKKESTYYYRGYSYKKLSKVGMTELEKMKKILLEKKAS